MHVTSFNHDNIASNDTEILILDHDHNILVAGQTKDEFIADSNYFTGWKVLIHDPSEFPEVNKKGIFIGSGQEASIAIDAEVSACSLFQAPNSGI